MSYTRAILDPLPGREAILAPTAELQPWQRGLLP